MLSVLLTSRLVTGMLSVLLTTRLPENFVTKPITQLCFAPTRMRITPIWHCVSVPQIPGQWGSAAPNVAYPNLRNKRIFLASHAAKVL